MKNLVIICSVFILFCSYSKSAVKKTGRPLTMKYAGAYCESYYGKDNPASRLWIYPETDSTLLFYITFESQDLSTHSGSLYGSVKMNNDTGIFYTERFRFQGYGCKWSFKFVDKMLIIKTMDTQRVVMERLEYRRKSKKVQDYFVNEKQKKIFYATVTPEEYYKNWPND